MEMPFARTTSINRSPLPGMSPVGRRSRWEIAIGALIVCAILSSSVGAQDAPAASDYTGQVRPLLMKYCVECHQGDQAQNGITIDTYQAANAKGRDRATWTKVLRQLQGKVMPPADAAQPTDAERRRMIQWIEEFALTPDCSAGERPGRVTLRRLNRAEYNNTVRDLFGVTVQPANDFPSDDVGYGFDNIGDVLTLPPLLLERYLDAAEKVVRAAILTPDVDGAPSQTRPGGTLASVGEVGGEFEFTAPAEYLIRVRASGDQAGPDPCRMTFRLDGKDLKTVDVPNSTSDPRFYELRQRIGVGKHKVTVAFLNDYYMPNSLDPKLKGDRNLHVEQMIVVGPIGVLPSDLPAHHARLMNLYDASRKQGDSLERAVQLTLQALLVTPSFLFRIESDPPAGKVRDLSDFELASRLSYFLWGSLPDDELFRAAAQGQLHTDDQLKTQALRMLADPRSQALVENFAGQWLQLRNLDTFTPDKQRFPDYDDALRAAARRETETFFAHVMREDRSVLEFLDADYTFVNERLAKHYGLKDVKGDEFRRVSVDRSQRGGLLGQMSILAVTSNPTRTSPVKRGKWVLENLFAAPPPPAPPNVPELADGKDKPLVGTLRQRMEQHRVKPSCAACHQLMDPLGFGLENYDAIGGWRTLDGKDPIDPSGELPDGRTFKGPAELKTVLLARQREFRKCLAEKLLTYALGRGLEYYDACAVQRIADQCGKQNNRFSVLVTEIVTSPAFRQRESAP